jgi:hypothetical protein
VPYRPPSLSTVRPEVSKDGRALGAGFHRRVVSARLPGLAPAGELLSFASPKESNQRKGGPRITQTRPPLRGSLRYSATTGAAELGPCRASDSPRPFSVVPCVARRRTGQEGRWPWRELVGYARFPDFGLRPAFGLQPRRLGTPCPTSWVKPNLQNHRPVAQCGSPDAGAAGIRGKRARNFPDCAALHPGYKFFRVARRAATSSVGWAHGAQQAGRNLAPAVGLKPNLQHHRPAARASACSPGGLPEKPITTAFADHSKQNYEAPRLSPLTSRSWRWLTGAVRACCLSRRRVCKSGQAGAVSSGQPEGPRRRGALLWFLSCRVARKELARRGESRQSVQAGETPGCVAPNSWGMGR